MTNKNDIKLIYPYATHPERMSYQKQDPIAGTVVEKTMQIATTGVVADIIADVDYIKSMYPYATHPERMIYQKQDAVSGTVIEDSASSQLDSASELTETLEPNSTTTANFEELSNVSSTVSTSKSDLYAENITAGTVVNGVVSEAPLTGSVLYSGSKVSLDITYLSSINVGEVITGSGGQAPLEGSVLYRGSNVSRGNNGLINVVVTNAGEPIKSNVTYSPQVSAVISSTISASVTDYEDMAMEYDVVIVGGGPAGLSSAIRMKQLAKQDGKEISVCVVEKGSELGSHILSGAIFEPRALNELIPNWQELGAPLDTPAISDEFLILTKNKFIRIPPPPQMHNKGNYIISLGKFVSWLGGIAEEMGVEVYTSTSAAEILKENGRVVGIKIGALGIDKDGNKTSQYVEGMELRAKYTVMGEGARGHLTKELFADYNLRADVDPQTFGIGIKELWEIDPEKSQPGKIVHTAGWPLDSETYGGSFLYHLKGNLVSVGFVIGLDYKNPHLYPYMEFQRFKHHPKISEHLEGGRRISYGARVLNEGGLQSIPKLTFDGGVIIGCSAGFLNVPKIKGTHTAMKSGMIAGEEIYKAVQSSKTYDELISYSEAIKKSWVYQELKKVRNIRPSFHKFGLFGGMAYSGFTTLLGGREPWTFKQHDDHSTLRHKDKSKKIEYPTPDGKLSFDRLTNVAFSGTQHGKNQPVHLQLKDKTIPISVNLKDYDLPETRFCPAGVYELVEQDGKPALQINSQNCVHCKTCDIKDPCQNINWVVPEGGNGPNYQGM